ncbi:hypothetical protein MASR1M107_05440 [Ignavibacteriales bacterium]
MKTEIKVGDRVRVNANRKKPIVTIYRVENSLYYGISDKGTRYEVYESDLELVNSSNNSNSWEKTNIPELPESPKTEPINKIYEMFTRDLSMDSRQFSTLDAAVGCFEYQIEYYKGWDVDLRELTPNKINEYTFAKLLARYSSDDGEVNVFDSETEKAFTERRIEYVVRSESKLEAEHAVS